MADLDIHLSALDRCRTAINTATGQYEDTLSEHNPGELTYNDNGRPRSNRPPINADTFGDLTDSATLATASNDVWDTIIGEMDEARRKLADAERGLNSVEENIRSTHRATS
ncbi:hypothetical protein ACFOY2_51130 [Nonomuraea purpurea]|uniref:PE domain-containing protein n=1 Tax=Nonomuraea purpurea TaxID=1849276 RepID=A0ABV8GTS8_9ACTN